MTKKENISEEQIEIKKSIKELNKLAKHHAEAKSLLNEAGLLVSLLKNIFKHEKKTTTRPEEIYISNIKKQINETIEKLNKFYG